MNSYWVDTTERPKFPKLDKNVDTDVCIIGAGITGIMTAYMLLNKGLKITLIDYFKAQKESDEYLKENPSEFYDENQIFSDELFNTYKLKKMDEVKDTVDYDITFNLNKVDGQWKLESPDRIILEKIHGLYDYTSDN